MTKELAGRVAIVTGAGKNIGKAIALALADGGAKVVVNGRSDRASVAAVVAEIGAKGGDALAVMADVSDEASVAGLVQATVERFGRLDILVNNAAIRTEKPFDALTYAEFRAVQAVIVDGAFLTSKAAYPHLKRGTVSAIVNIGGMSAHTGGKGRAHVVAAKAGLVGLTKGLAHDLAASGITVNCVAPGLIATARQGPTPQHLLLARSLVPRQGLPEEIAAAVRFLVGPGARYITGQTLHVNGGTFLP
ncbi:MAG: 3-oxoacyl-ACP reductase family protein [Myxococcales bacterium]